MSLSLFKEKNIIIAVLMTIAIFAVDLLTPLWYEVWVLYLIPLFFMYQSAKRPYVYSAIVTLLVAAGLFPAHPDSTHLMRSVINRLTGIGGGWGVSLLLMRLKRLHVSLIQHDNELKKSEEKLRTVADLTYDWGYWIAPDREILYCSPSCSRITGYSPEEFIKTPSLLSSIIHPEDIEIYNNHMEHFYDENKQFAEGQELEFRIIAQNGEVKWIGHVCRQVFNKDGVFLGRRVSNRDITDRKKAEDYISALYKELELQVTELDAANRGLDSFTYSVSHDLRAPLRTISGFIKILLEEYAEKLDAQGRDFMNRVYTGSERMKKLIDSLLHLSRISRQEMDRIEFNISSRASSIVADLHQLNPGRSIEVNIQEGLAVFADPGLIDVVLSNLLGNSWKFTSKTDNARIDFGALEQDGKTVFYVRDNGAGFDPAYMDKMFAPFQRLHSDKEFEGTGIGLSIVERIIRRHGGRIWADGETGKGATFFFTLN